MSSFSVKVNPLPRWNHTPDAIASDSDKLVKDVSAVYDRVSAQTELTKENVLTALATADNYISCLSGVLTFYADVSTQPELRDVSSDCKEKLEKFSNELDMRKDIFDVLTKFYEQRGGELSPTEKRYLSHRLRDARRNGLHLDEETRKRMKELKDKLSELSVKFEKNLTEENTTLRFKEKDLDGVPSDDLQRFKSETVDGEKWYTVTLKYPDYFPTMKYCKVAETRRQLETAFNSRCVESNTALLEEAIKLRHEKANLLGFKTHADYVLEVLMAKKREQVHKFLTELFEKLRTARDSDLRKMRELKAREVGQPEDSVTISNWDLRYYQTRIESSEFCVDHTKLREYFALDSVLEKLFDIYQELLSLKFVRVADAETWHPDVHLYEVLDAADGASQNSRLGYFYLDLHPRDGKYGHAACFPIHPPCVLPDGTRQLSVCALVCNFPKATDQKPSLLLHEDVETLFHEFGHAMHAVCTKADYDAHSFAATECDFVELPSQILENWVWEAEGLKRVGQHYKTGEAIPSDEIERLIRSRLANVGMLNCRQVALSLFDLNAHCSDKCDTQASFAQLWTELTTLTTTPGTNFAASFGHLMGGYDSGYYSYLWSEVYAMDMFYSRFKKEGIFNRQLGLEYRRKVLEPGASLDGMDMCVAFLGREPRVDSFLLSKGIAVPAATSK